MPVQSMVTSDQQITLRYDQKLAETLLNSSRRALPREPAVRPTSLVVIYSYGDFHAATKAARFR